MIKRSFATTVILLSLYQAWLWWAQPIGEHTLRGLHNMIFADGNIIRAQRYIHGRHDQPIVFVGTSLTATLEPYLSDPDVACLGMPGMSAVDGLLVIERSGAHPQLVMIEVNLLHREPSKDLHDEVMQPGFFWLHQRFSATLHEYQPANLLVPRLDAARRGELLQPRPVLPAHPLTAGHIHQPSYTRGRYDMLQHDVERSIAKLPEVYQLAQRLKVPLGLYLLPEHRDINRAPALKQLCEAAEKCFQQPVVICPDDQMCTADGQHLAEEDASACAYLLLQYARKRVAAGHP